MDLNTDLPGPPGIGDRAGDHAAPLFNYPDQLDLLPGIVAAPLQEARPSMGSLYDKAAHTAQLAASERDKFLEGWLRIQDDERLRLGRELHDSTGQLLLALRLNVAQLKRSHGTPIEDELLSEIENMVGHIDREIRSFAFLHYPAEIDRGGLADALRYLVHGFASRTGLRATFVDLCDRLVAGGPAANALLRIAQEALMNVHRHARALHVRVSLTVRDKLLELIVRDDGIGIPPSEEIARSHGVGLVGMRHRVERLGGHFAIKRLKSGTKLTASVPLV